MASLMDSTHFTLMDWKNKEGKTLQLAIYPPNSSVSDMNFEWRLSSAFMQANNKFSSYTEYNRVILQTEGFEFPMKLNIHNKDNATLQPFVPFYFDGSDVVDCEVNGFVKDFNVMTKKGMWEASVSTTSNYAVKNENNNSTSFHLNGDLSFLYCVSGTLRLKIVVDNGNIAYYSLNTNEMLKFENDRKNTVFDVEISEQNTAVVFVDLIKTK